MAVKSIQNYDYRGTQPNFVRDQFATLAEMNSWPTWDMDAGHLSYCIETGKTYRFTGSAWQEFSGEGGSGGDKSQAITVGTAASVWTLNHSLAKYPSVTCIDSSGRQILGDVVYVNLSQVTVTFGEMISGTAILN